MNASMSAFDTYDARAKSDTSGCQLKWRATDHHVMPG